MTDTTNATAPVTPAPNNAPAAAAPATPDTSTPAPAPADATPANAPAPAPDAKPATPQGAPEAYTPFTLPDGASMDDAGLTAFAEFAKGLDLSQDAAQAMLDKLAPAAAKRQADQVAALRAEWKAQTSADAELGKPENLAVVKEAMTKFGDPELHELLEGSGLIDHPAIVRAFLKAGRAISQDTVMPGRTPGQSAHASVAQRLYPNMNP